MAGPTLGEKVATLLEKSVAAERERRVLLKTIEGLIRTIQVNYGDIDEKQAKFERELRLRIDDIERTALIARVKAETNLVWRTWLLGGMSGVMVFVAAKLGDWLWSVVGPKVP